MWCVCVCVCVRARARIFVHGFLCVSVCAHACVRACACVQCNYLLQAINRNMIH